MAPPFPMPVYTYKSYFQKLDENVGIFCIVYTSQYYDIHKIRQYQKLELWYDYTTGRYIAQH